MAFTAVCNIPTPNVVVVAEQSKGALIEKFGLLCLCLSLLRLHGAVSTVLSPC